jgi:hypothetical protein
MSAECCFTDDPEYILKKEYDGKPNIDDLHEVFVIVYKVDTVTKEFKKSARFVFIKSLEKAMKQWKIFGPRGALLHRIFTDDDDINELALDNENKKAEDIVETDSLEPIKAPEIEVKPECGNTLNRITYDV